MKASKSDARRLTDAQKLAAFIEIETPVAGAPMWPVHTLRWLQPELGPVRPRSSGLRIERRYKPPMPDFVASEVAAADFAHSRQHACEPLPPRLARTIPQSGLAPLGWEPRAVKGGPQ